ncbi:glycosyltransferase family 4 protein [Clavibacter sp. MX14-G9D]|uniref:glycosyltransferase family 4 protein n=1 Tax=Clavibacter sp. MX14-G9D TaxID=3064656 RepID=UPI00293EAF57|nr:glycosyltransferase family 4 protein [Clavibacter sp. MX14-G9D]
MTASSVPALRSSRVRLYESLRTAHLERAHQLAPASILYRVTRYDFDHDAARGLDLVQAGRLRAGLVLLRSDVRVLEVNEPLMLSSLPATAVALAAVGMRRMVGRPRTSVVTYAIGNADPFDAPVGPRLRSRLRRTGERLLARWAMRRVDRIVYGTAGAQEVYRAVLGGSRADASAELVLALPEPHDARPSDADPGSVVFVGALSERKGIRVLLAAWPSVRDARPDAVLRILGKGPLEAEVAAAAASDPSIVLEVDPERSRIHAAMRSSAVLTLPSQPSPTWREQVGLPIVEGLSHGCTIVTTTETGLADWLRELGHGVTADPSSPSELAAVLVDRLDAPVARDAVLSALPHRDGRLAADDVLFAADVPAGRAS